MSTNRDSGFSLVEMVVCVAIGAFILIITGTALNDVTKVFRNTSGRDSALRELQKARRSLEFDLRQASLNQLVIQPAPATRGGGADGVAVDFLSAVNATDGTQTSLSDGSGNPYFFLNLVYYVTTPTNHDSLFGCSCVGGNVGGFDFVCPHKLLIRVVEDENPTYDPSDPTTQDALLPTLAASLTQPIGFPRSATRETIAINLLTFQIVRQNKELIVELQAVSIADAQRKVGIGVASFKDSSYTIVHQFSVFPRN